MKPTQEKTMEFEIPERIEELIQIEVMDTLKIAEKANGKRKGAFEAIDKSVHASVRQALSALLASSQDSFRRKVDEIDGKKHTCRFNDGEQKCDCYYEALKDVRAKLKNINL